MCDTKHLGDEKLYGSPEYREMKAREAMELLKNVPSVGHIDEHGDFVLPTEEYMDDLYDHLESNPWRDRNGNIIPESSVSN